jgi:hypothetical protein
MEEVEKPLKIEELPADFKQFVDKQEDEEVKNVEDKV